MLENLSGIEKLVCHDIAERQQFGIKKYGITVEENPLTQKQWLTHAYQEALGPCDLSAKSDRRDAR